MRATELRVLRKEAEGFCAHAMSTLHEPESPMPLAKDLKPLAAEVKRWETLVKRSAAAVALAGWGRKISTVCVAPSVGGDHHVPVRSAISPTRTGPIGESGAAEPMKIISASTGRPETSMPARKATASGDVMANRAAEPPSTGFQAASRALAALAEGVGTSRLVPMRTRFAKPLAASL